MATGVYRVAFGEFLLLLLLLLRSSAGQNVYGRFNRLAGCVPALVNRRHVASAKVALRCCQFVALVVELESTSLAAAPAMLKALDSWGVGGPLMGVVLVQRILDTSSMTVGYVRSHLACPLVGVIPPAPDLCAQALRSGSPLVFSKPDSLCAAALGELAGRLAAEHVSALTF